jgi:hypothetical protein
MFCFRLQARAEPNLRNPLKRTNLLLRQLSAYTVTENSSF